MKVTQRTDQELQNMNLIDPGQYPFEIIESVQRLSKSGNEMIALKLKIWDINGHERIVFDYLLDSMAHKVKSFCRSVGLLDKYESGELLPTDCLGKCGSLNLVIQKDKTGQYSDRNSVKDYLNETIVAKAKPAETEFKDDDIPF